jgi:hypothetical protein
MHILAGVVRCRRGRERQAGAARPDLVNAAILPSAQSWPAVIVIHDAFGMSQGLHDQPARVRVSRPDCLALDIEA